MRRVALARPLAATALIENPLVFFFDDRVTLTRDDSPILSTGAQCALPHINYVQ
jgi:hypothetical protein